MRISKGQKIRNSHTKEVNKQASEKDIPTLAIASNSTALHGNMVSVLIGKKPFSALADSGASVSCISSKTLSSLPFKPVIHNSTIPVIKGVSGTLVSVLGETEISEKPSYCNHPWSRFLCCSRCSIRFQ